MRSRTQQLAEENVQTTAGPSPALRGVGSYGPEPARREVASPSQAGERRVTRMSRVARQEWAPSILIFLLDVVTWMAIYGMASYLRNDTAFSGSFQFAVIEIIQIAIIV